MGSKLKKILYLATEITPFLTHSDSAAWLRGLVGSVINMGYDARVVMPLFKGINERTSQLHEVKRLGGINVEVGDERLPLIVKVGSVREARLQVYFMGYEEENCSSALKSIRSIEEAKSFDFWLFNSKAILQVIHHLGWTPDIIHSIGWPWSPVLPYGKLVYRKRNLLEHTCFVHTYDPLPLPKAFGASLRTLIKDELPAEALKAFGMGSLYDLNKLASIYADGTTLSLESLEEPMASLLKEQKAKLIPKGQHLPIAYVDYYLDLLGKEKSQPDS